MFEGDPSQLAFMGHTHRPLLRDLPKRRLVNVGSVGLPLDGDPRASYVVAVQTGAGDWSVELRRVAYDVESAVAAYDNGMRDADPGFVAIMSRQLRSARDFFGPWLRLSDDLPDDTLDAALRRYLAEHP